MTHGVIMTGIVIKKIKNWRRLTNISQFVGIVHTVDRKRVVNQLLIERTDRISFFLGTWGRMHFTFYLIIITYAAVNPNPRAYTHVYTREHRRNAYQTEHYRIYVTNAEIHGVHCQTQSKKDHFKCKYIYI